MTTAQETQSESAARTFSLVQAVLIALVTLITGTGGGIGIGAAVRGDGDSKSVGELSDAVRIVAENQKLLQYQVGELVKKVDALSAATADRWTATKQESFSTRVETRFSELEARLRDHIREPWHTQAGARHAETKRRVDRIEARLDRIEEAQGR